MFDSWGRGQYTGPDSPIRLTPRSMQRSPASAQRRNPSAFPTSTTQRPRRAHPANPDHGIDRRQIPRHRTCAHACFTTLSHDPLCSILFYTTLSMHRNAHH